jgi:hypothetical protein
MWSGSSGLMGVRLEMKLARAMRDSLSGFNATMTMRERTSMLIRSPAHKNYFREMLAQVASERTRWTSRNKGVASNRQGRHARS